jgi:serine/threonine protein kinase
VTSPLTQGFSNSNPIGFLGHRVGDRIKDRYDVLERLGGGNFGSVYRVLDSAVGNVLACKEMHVLDNPNTATNEREAALDLFKREALNLATLRHPNIPAAYFDQEEGEWNVCPVCGLSFTGQRVCPEHGANLLLVNTRYYLMMDYVDGPTLEELAVNEMQSKGRPLEEEQCLEWLYQITLAVRTLHRVGIIHRDIKPENIKIRSSDNAAVLLDLGLTKKVEEAGGYGTAPMTGTARFGTAGYAPENPEERERPERRSDIHALGMTLYRLLSDRDPQILPQLREMRANSPRYFNHEISPEVENLIQNAIAPDMNQRFQSIDDFVAEIQGIRVPDSGIISLPPFTFSDGQKARTATDLARLLDTHEEEATGYLFNGMFSTWLLQNGFANPAQVAENVVKNYKGNPPVALEMFRRALYPTGTSHIMPRLEWTPATLNLGSLPSGAKETATIKLKNIGPGLVWGNLGIPVARKRGQTMLAAAVKSILAGGDGEEDSSLPGMTLPAHFQGNEVDVELLLDTNKVPTGSYSSHILVETDSGEFRIPVSYTVVPLELAVEPQILDFGNIEVGKRMSITMQIKPVDERGGTPRGSFYVGPSLSGLVAPERFEGTAPLSIIVDASSPAVVAKHYDGLLLVDTNGGRLRIPVRYSVVLPIQTLATMVTLSTIWGAIGGAALRLTYFIVNPEFTSKWLVRKLSSGAGFGLQDFQQGIGPLIAGAVLSGYGLWLYAGRMKNIVPRERPGFLKNSDDNMLNTLPMLGIVFGAFIGYLAAQLLHWTFWSVGDWLLNPIALRFPGDFGDLIQTHAPLMWAVIGAVSGLLWGVSKVLSATGRGSGRILFAVFTITLFLMLLFNATISVGGERASDREATPTPAPALVPSEEPEIVEPEIVEPEIVEPEIVEPEPTP